MPRSVGSGRPGTRVFPVGWAATVANVTGRDLDSTITIGPAGTVRTWSDEAGQSVTTAADPSYAGPAALRPASVALGGGAVDRVAAQEPVSVALYEIALPHPTTGIEAGHVVRVDTSPDQLLVGRFLTVDHIEGGDRHATRLLRATLND